MSNQEYNARFSILEGDTSGLQALEKVSAELAESQKATDGMTKRLADMQRALTAVKAKPIADITAQAELLNKELAALDRDRQLEELARNAAFAATDIFQAEDAATQLAIRLQDIGASNDEITDAARRFDRYRKSIEGAERAIEDLNREQRRGGGRRGGDDQFDVGNVGTASSALGGLTSNFNNEVGGVFQAFGDAGDVGESLQRLPSTFANITAAINPVSAAVVALGVSSAIAVNQIVAGSKALDSAIAADLQATVDVRRNIAEGLTTADAEAEIQRLIKLREAEVVTLNEQIALREQANQAAERQGALGQAALALVNATSNAEQKSADIQKEALQNATDYGARIQELRQAMIDGSLAANDTAAAELELAKIREQEAGALAGGIRSAIQLVTSGAGTEELNAEIQRVTASRNAEFEVMQQLRAAGQENTAAYEQSQAALEAYNTQLGVLNSAQIQSAARTNDAAEAFDNSADASQRLSEVLNSFAQETAERSAQAALQAADEAQNAYNQQADAAADLKKQIEQTEAQHKNNLLSITERGNDQIEALNAQLAERIASNNAAIEKVQTDFEKAELKARQQYLRRRAEIESSADADALTALINNDATRLAEIRRQEAADLSSLDTDEGIRASEATAERDERIQALKDETAAFTAEINTRIAESQRQTQEQLQAAQAAHEERLRLDEEERAERQRRADRDAAIAEQREERNASLEEARRKLALAARLSEIDTVEAQQAAATARTQAGIEGLEAVATQFKGLVDTIVFPAADSISRAIQTDVTPYGMGAGATFPAVESYPNLPPIPQSAALPSNVRSIPASPQLPNTAQRGIGSNGAPVVNNNYTVNVTVPGGGATQQDLENVRKAAFDGIREAQQTTIEGVASGLAKARQGA